MNLNIMSTKFTYTKWLIPFIVICLLITISLIFTGDFSENFLILFVIFVMTILVGFLEELMFRGIIFSCLAIIIKNIIPLMIYHLIWDFSLVSQKLTNANIEWITPIGMSIEIIIVVPLLIYTIHKYK